MSGIFKMADSQGSSSQGSSLLDTDHSKSLIQCKSERSIRSLLEIIEKEVDNVVGNNSISSNEEKARCKERFIQMYKTVFIHNLQVNGQTVEDLDSEDSTKEFEPLDVEKKDYISNVLLEKVDACIVETSRKRKRCPKSVQSGLKKRIKHDFSHLLHLKVQTESCMNNQEEMAVSLQSIEKTSQNMAATLSKITKETEKSVARAKDVAKSLRIFSKCQKNEIGKFLYKTSPKKSKPCPQLRACIWRNAREINQKLHI